MRKIIIILALGMTCGVAHAALFTDDFNRATTPFETGATTSIGSGYELTQTAGDRTASIRVLNPTLQLIQDNPGGSTVNAGNIVFRQTGIELTNSGAGESFTVSGDLTTFSAAAGTLLYGLTFNYQPDGSFYAARIDTGTDATVMQFIRVNAAGATGAFGSVANSTPLALSSVYTLTIESSAVGVFNYTLDGANLDGGQLAGTATDTVLNLENGHAGFYASAANTTPRYDNLSIQTIPEPATLGLIGLAGLGLFVRRRLLI